ncbi:MAG: STAS domain-containing protein [Actinomycetota bacterium]
MPYDIHHADDIAHVRLAGPLTFAEHRKFRRVVDRLEAHAPSRVVLDLSQVEHIDAAGLGLLLVARDTVRTRGGRAELHGAGGEVGRMIALSRFTDLFHG